MTTQQSDKKLFKLISTLTLIILVVILAYQNSDSQTLTFYFWKTQAPLFVALFVAFLLGIVVMIVLLYPKYRKASQLETQLEDLRKSKELLEKKWVALQSEKTQNQANK